MTSDDFKSIIRLSKYSFRAIERLQVPRLHPGPKKNDRTHRSTKASRKENANAGRAVKLAQGQKNSKSKRKPIPQKVLIHAARALPTPEIFKEASDDMPFSTEGQ